MKSRASTETSISTTPACMSTKRQSARPKEIERSPGLAFGIAVRSSPERPRHAMKHGDSFLVIDNHGDIGVSAGGPDGLFHSDTRYLSCLEVRGLTRPQRGRVRAEIGEGVVRLFYAGLDHLTRQTEIRFDPRPMALKENSASFRLDLMPQGSASFYATVCCDPEGIERTPFLRVMRQT